MIVSITYSVKLSVLEIFLATTIVVPHVVCENKVR